MQVSVRYRGPGRLFPLVFSNGFGIPEEADSVRPFLERFRSDGLEARQYAPALVPPLAEWKQLWSVWDLATTKMIPPDVLMEQPIPLRNPLLEDIYLTRATNSKPTEPAYYHQIFERGIDPDVDDPSKFHDHSELPDVFLCLEDILQYREHVKARIMALYESEKPYTDRCIGRALWIVFEHEMGLSLL
ncbi:hypothetical protein HZ326_10511 [Fusarium oxysporum f. sp. albedinis]|nr:hypothetical protein HZ326_10511 [Fusarium oxysporum f. sp. albedinis]